MSSILTNNSAMVALQTLNTINKNLATTQNEISTGKSTSSARDNSAIWAISQVMQSDVDGFNAIRDSLALGESTVAVGRNASESVTDLLGQIKEKIVASQEDNVDREKLQADLASLRDQITGIVSAAQFNGQNLLSNTSTTASEGQIDVLASLDRDATGNVTSNNISVGKQDLGQTDNTAGTTANNVGANAAVADGATGLAGTFTQAAAAGETYEVIASNTLGLSADVSYVSRTGDTLTDVTEEIVNRLNFQAKTDGVDLSFTTTTNAGEIQFTNNTGAAITVVAADVAEGDGTALDGTIGGGLELLGDIDISTALGAEAALSAIEGLTQTAINAASEFGTGEKRLDIQADFVSKLTDSLKSGIGALVDANMEEASARLQALQVQQQLGIQSLSIANQAPQSILSLFR